MSAVFLTLLAGWLLLSIMAQLRPLAQIMKKLYRWDSFCLIPHWAFFTNPKTDSLHLWYRDTQMDGTTTHWQEVAFCNRSLWQGFWNPKRYHWKILSHAGASLLEIEEQTFSKEYLRAWPPYQFTCAFVLKQPRQNISLSRQFMLAYTSGIDPIHNIESVFLSLDHRWSTTESVYKIGSYQC